MPSRVSSSVDLMLAVSVVVNLYIKFEVSILNGCGDIFDENFVI